MDRHHFGFYINILARYLNKNLQKNFAATGLNSTHWPVIFCLMSKGALSQKEICEQLAIEAPAISKTIANMESSGWVQRSVDHEDKRGKIVELTKRAQEQFTAWDTIIYALEDRELTGINNEQLTIFLKVLEQLINNQKIET